MKSFNYTHKGKRKVNEDFFLASRLKSNNSVFIIADGMGGYSKGEIASKIVAESIYDYLNNDKSKKSYKNSIKEAVKYANKAIQKAGSDMNIKMGATFASLLITPKHTFAFWMGDVRIYQFDNKKIVFQTKDHSMVNELSKERELTISEIERYSSLVTNCLISDSDLGTVEIVELSRKPNSSFLICSDGFYRSINPLMLNLSDMKCKEKMDEIVSNANDNSTFMLIEQ